MITPSTPTKTEDSAGKKSQHSAPKTHKKTFAQQCYKGFKICTRTLFYIPFSILVIIAILLSTPIGSHVTVLLANTFVPGLSIHYHSGIINRNLSVSQASWQMQGIKVKVNKLTLQWNPACVFYKQLCVKNLTAQQVQVDIDTHLLGEQATNAASSQLNGLTDASSLPHTKASITTPKTDESETPTDVRLPFDISLSQLDLQQVHVRVNDMNFSAKQLRGQAIWNEPGLQVDWLTSQDLKVDIPLNTQAKTAKTPNTTRTDSHQVKTNKNNKTLSGQDATAWAMAALPQVRLPFALFVREFNAQDNQLILGHRVDNFAEINIEGTFIGHNLHLSDLSFKHDYGNASINGYLDFIDDYPMNINGNFDIDKIKELPDFTKQQLQLGLNGSFAKLTAKAQLTGTNKADVSTTINLTTPALTYQANIKDAQLHWPLNTPIYQLHIDSLTSSGDVHHQQVRTKSKIDSPYAPTLNVDTHFYHQNQQLNINHLNINSTAGNLLVDGHMNYQQQLQWDVNVIADNLLLNNIPALNHYDIFDGKINGQVTQRGHIKDGKWQLSVENTNLNGELNHRPFTLLGDMSLNQNWEMNAKNLQASMLGSALTINGIADKQWDINAKLSVPDLSLWLNGAKGSIAANISVSGEQNQPQVNATASINNVAIADYKAQNIQLSAQYSPLTEHKFAATTTLTQAIINGIHIKNGQFNINGDQYQQQAKLVTQGDVIVNSVLTTETDIDKQTLVGKLQQFDIDHLLGYWQLQQPIDFKWDNLAKVGKVSQFCIGQSQHQLCLVNPVKLGKQGSVNMQFAGEPGKLLKKYLPKNMLWQGNAAMNLDLAWQPEQKPTASVNLILTPGSIKLTGTDTREVSFDYQLLQLNGDLKQDKLHSSIKLLSEKFASAEGKLTIDIANQKAVDGYFNINQLNLLPLVSLFPQFATLEGKISSEIQLSGTLASPITRGVVRINDGAFALTSNPTLVNDLNAKVNLLGQQAKLIADWKMGEGTLTSTGTLNWSTGKLSGKVDLQGDKLAVIQPPLAILDVSPDISLRFTQDKLDIDGNIAIPSGKITIVQLSDEGIALSDDVVFSDSISELEQKKKPFLLTTNLNINVGNDVQIDGMGLQGKLSGTLQLKQESAKPPLLFGDIKVNNGSYKFMGQTLTINTGELQFSGPPSVANLNIEATKDIKDEDIVAGVRVTGTSLKPIVTIFSNPAKEQAEVLSYILTGKGFTSSSSDQNNALMLNTALSLGTQLGGNAINNIGDTASSLIEKFGFSNVQLDANDDGRVAVSGFIGDSLMVKYGIGVFNPGYEMTVRYYLLSQLYLESVSSTLTQSLDIYYSFDIE
ncbi:translocation/assembly module TamB domain-containing protein [Shewanella intestini]|uniref:Translocation and assembly module TamB C-terminal domain-containing protein n=1 Tax=Shewanella intestini TaxID=2017544 RepID=A0ABS5HYS4_9GAMM|nr:MULTISPECIES: translocation/assembly module TamB domain-containing protein [Shewanella]MBR9726945.1 hypothetical protein [Shewanella intestini]